MISLSAALEGICIIRHADRCESSVPIGGFCTGNHQDVLQPGDLLRNITLPAAGLRRVTAFRRSSLTHLGRSTALLVGTLDPNDGGFALMVSASTDRFVRISFDRVPDRQALRDRLSLEIRIFFDDAHGSPDYREHMTYHFAEQIQRELGGQ